MGCILGLVAGLHGGKWPDKLSSAIAITGVSLPHYWFAMIMVMVFSVFLNLLPAQGIGDSGFPVTWDQIQYLILPVVTMSLIPMGVIGRIVRATVLDVVGKEFMEALNAKGLRNRRILRHVVKNAAPPVLAAMGLQFGYLVGGSILIETVFNWPGCGRLLNLAIFRRDIPEVQASILVLAFLFVLLNLAVDIGQALVDPRMRRGGARHDDRDDRPATPRYLLAEAAERRPACRLLARRVAKAARRSGNDHCQCHPRHDHPLGDLRATGGATGPLCRQRPDAVETNRYRASLARHR
jgi:ABC-type antimicrobial peptide transport system permease subunit